MLTVGKTVGVSVRDGYSILSAQFCYEPKSVLKNKISLFFLNLLYSLPTLKFLSLTQGSHLDAWLLFNHLLNISTWWWKRNPIFEMSKIKRLVFPISANILSVLWPKVLGVFLEFPLSLKTSSANLLAIPLKNTQTLIPSHHLHQCFLVQQLLP